MRFVRRLWLRARRDFLLKATSVLLALLVWFGAGDKQSFEFTESVPLQIKNLPADLVLLESLPPSIQVRIRGRGRFVKLRVKGAVASIDAGEAEPGLFVRPITIGDVVVPGGVDAEVREVIAPRTLRVGVDKKARRRVPVEAVLAGTPPQGFAVVGSPSASPPEVEVVGPAHVVAGLEAVRLEDLNVSRLRGPVALARRVDVSSLPMVEASPPEVEVQVSVDRVSERRIERVPVRIRLDDRRFHGAVTPDAIAVRLSGPEAIVSTLNADSLSLTIDARGIQPGTFDYRTDVVGSNRLVLLPAGEPIGAPSGNAGASHRSAVLSVPPGIQILDLLPSHFSVVVERAGARRKSAE